MKPLSAPQSNPNSHTLTRLFAGWTNPKPQVMYTEGDDYQVKEAATPSITNSSMLTSFVDPQLHHQQVPKLEDFLGGDSSSLVRYSESQTETQDSSLTHIYDHGSAYFNEQQDLKAIAATAGFQAFSTNSGSEVEDSSSIGRTQLASSDFPGHSIESGNELAFSHCPTGALSLGVTTTTTTTQRSDQQAIVSADSECSKKIADTFGQRTSIYRGVTRHRWTGRYEAHLWDNSSRREGQARKGRQATQTCLRMGFSTLYFSHILRKGINYLPGDESDKNHVAYGSFLFALYLGGYDKEEKAARAYDLAALKYWGASATTNFPVSNYTKELEEMKHVTKQEFIASLRRKSSGFSRGASIYRGVTRHHQQGRWQARIGRVAGNKDLYLGTFATEEEAAEAYDIAAIKFRGVNAVTNFEMNRYDVEAIANSALPIGGAAKRLKLSLESDQKPCLNLDQQTQSSASSSGITFGAIQPIPAIP
ncbi:unnamed protein product, partial [Vitis vinifera]